LASVSLGAVIAADAAQQPMFTNMMLLPEGHMQVQLKGEVGQSYTIELSTNLTTWVPVGSFRNIDTNLLTLVDPEPVASVGQRYYRMHVGVDVVYRLAFHHFVQGGAFNSGTTPAMAYPVSINSYSADFDVEGDTAMPAATNVFFSGPGGSSLANAAAEPYTSGVGTDKAQYQSPVVFNPPTAPGGVWVVNYRGTNHTFNLPDPQAVAHLVLPVPTVSLSGGVVQSVSWAYRDPASGVPMANPPAFMKYVQVQFFDFSGGRLYDSPNEASPSVTTHILSATVNWNDVQSVVMAYDDTLGNSYIIGFGH
jgi:hypothetical protein